MVMGDVVVKVLDIGQLFNSLPCLTDDVFSFVVPNNFQRARANYNTSKANI